MKTTDAQSVSGKKAIGKRLWIAIRGPLARSRAFNAMTPKLISAFLQFTFWSNRDITDMRAALTRLYEHTPLILALWHGQHLLVPALKRLTDKPVVGLFSRSADAEMNARVAAEMGLEIIRGSGGRASSDVMSKGGVKALLGLRKALSDGKNVAMIADISKGRPRESGMGIITLARASGRPIVPTALATSRRYVVERSWDKTTINLPFGRAVLICGEPIAVPRDADDAMMEQKRLEVTEKMNEVTGIAYSLLDGKT
jgi:lysophospholipid acyltransferase (LPLAT)-like uncharacterized protein